MLPHDLHESAAVKCFEAGKHVLLEKPMATAVDACERILAAGRRAATVFMLAENAQYWPEVLLAREQIAAGAIGEIVTAQVHLFFPPLEAFYGGERAWRMNRQQTGGGICIDTGSHYIRPLRLWLGEIDEVVAAMEKPYEKMEGESLARALFRFRSGRVASYDLMITEAPTARQNVFRITGTKGEIVIGLVDVTLYNAENISGVRVGADVPQGYFLSYEGQFRDFAAAGKLRDVGASGTSRASRLTRPYVPGPPRPSPCALGASRLPPSPARSASVPRPFIGPPGAARASARSASSRLQRHAPRAPAPHERFVCATTATTSR
jgi:predicted dehydrogenase